MLDILALVFTLIAFAGFTARRLITYLHIFQQEEYDGPRFLHWLFARRVFDKKASALLFLCGLLWFFGLPSFIISFVTVISFVMFTVIEKDPRKDSKKKLAMTDRAKRVFFASLAFCLLPIGLFVLMPMPWVWIIGVQAVPFLLVLGNLSLQPYEDAVQNRFWKEAHEKLITLSPTVIGITGSYGKTSVKHILAHILASAAPTLATPGSVNTPMGISRIIREQLDERIKYFIVEMGAYGPGSIARLCKLAPPNHGIITAIGHAHYERFKSLEAVAETKFELAQSALSREGKVIAHEKTFKFNTSSDMRTNHPDSFIVCGSEGAVDLKVVDIKQKSDGLEIKTLWGEKSSTLKIPLFGLHHGMNAAMAYAMAVTLGLDPDDVRIALKSTPQIPHRLEVKKTPKGSLIIDDAYNSNPAGFYSALDLLDFIGAKKRSILITPGIVELGKAHDEVHRQVGEYAAGKCDICLVVQPDRIPTFVTGFEMPGARPSF
ncbi:MAG: UDP-N-acetylmuramoyl-tripeptide--D-alanyl-D-alanine ligase [Alphaproteobacteria bacterium]|nr:UDP-N-acetylmuramoyl-tripeptide--D-alanyl-D-alanine ligase [Alphaproteobacteria bacterium]